MHLKQINGYFKFRYGDLIFIKWALDGLLLFMFIIFHVWYRV